jgi:phage FluMu protein Com
MNEEAGARQCPYCKEKIRADAIRCKHCRSTLAPEAPSHGGTCPFCKEAIHPEAIRCKHCGTMLAPVEPGVGCQECKESSGSLQTDPTQSMAASPPFGGAGAAPSIGTAPLAIFAQDCGPCERKQAGQGTSWGSRICWRVVLLKGPGGSSVPYLLTWEVSCDLFRYEPGGLLSPV